MSVGQSDMLLLDDVCAALGYVQGLAEGSTWAGAKPITAEVLEPLVERLTRVRDRLLEER
jgi:hypothetical protein